MHDKTERRVAEHWNRNADQWSKDVRAGFDSYRDRFTFPAFLSALPDIKGLRIVDFGCGEGSNTRQFAKLGARVTGIDFSSRMLALAKAEEEAFPLGIDYRLASFSACPQLESGAFDAVLSTLALMDGPDFAGAMREAYRLLKPGGFLLFSILHPCFVSPGLSWIKSDAGETTGLGVAEYFSATPFVEEWKFGDNPDKAEVEAFSAPRFPRTMSDIINAVCDSGLVIQRLEEPIPSEEACLAYPRFRRWRDLAAFLLIVKAEKP